jgi:hypothetical protein
MEPGLARDVVRTGGEMVAPGVAAGSVMRQAAVQIPQVLPRAQTVGEGIISQMGRSTAGGDVVYSAASGAGSEVGRELGGEEGALVGAFLAPAGVAGVQSLGGLLNRGKQGMQALFKSVEGMSDDGAATLLAEAMVREGLSPDDVAKRLAELGPDALPADIGNNFARLLRVASNKIPRIEGRASEVLGARQATQGERVLSAVDDATGTSSLTVDDEIARLDRVLKPRIKELYSQAKSQSMRVSDRLRNMLEGKNPIGNARKKAEKIELAAKRLSGEEVTNIDVIDATKRQLDDQIGGAIRKGENNKARSLITLKNQMVSEADQAIPEYAQARDLYAGKAALESAADKGSLFLRMKPRDVDSYVSTLGQSERKMFKLGAKQAILDKIDDTQTTSDAVRRLFGKKGDVKKLRQLFDTKEEFDRFAETLKREANFTQTRRAAQSNSTTVQQASDADEAFDALKEASEAISSPQGAANVLGRVLSRLTGKKGDEAFTRALEEVGDILLVKGMDPTKIQAILRRGVKKEIEAELRKALGPELKATRSTPITTGVLSESQRVPERTQQQTQ